MPLTIKPDQPSPIGLAVVEPGTLAFGTPWTCKVSTSPPLDAVYWTGVYGEDVGGGEDTETNWYDNPPNKLALAANGTGEFTLEFRTSGDSVVVLNTWPNPTIFFESGAVTIEAPEATPTPTVTPRPTATPTVTPKPTATPA